MRTRSMLLSMLCAAVAGGCAKRVPEPAGAAKGTPRISWIIMAGDRDDPDRDYICQSDPRDECVMPASRSDEPVFSHVYVYYHPAAAETTYTGSIRIGFFQGEAAAQEVRPNITVKANDRLGNGTVAGIVTSRQGTFPVNFELMATTKPTGATRQVRDRIDVVVR